MVVKRSTSIWIISGDFNTATSPIVNDVLKHTTIQPYTFCRIEKNRVKKSITDWVYFNTNRDIQSQTQSIENTLSDHVILINDFTTSVTNYPSPLLLARQNKKSWYKFNLIIFFRIKIKMQTFWSSKIKNLIFSFYFFISWVQSWNFKFKIPKFDLENYNEIMHVFILVDLKLNNEIQFIISQFKILEFASNY